MAKKKNKNKNKNQKTKVEVVDASTSEISESEMSEIDVSKAKIDEQNEQKAREVKAKDKKVKSNKKAKKPNSTSLSDKIKGTYSELKKVEWPSFSRVVKQTGVVLAFVAIFVVILLGFNSLFGWLFELFTNATQSASV